MAQLTQRHRKVEPKTEAQPRPAPAPFHPRPSRLRPLLFILALTTLALVAHQYWRLNGRASPQDLVARGMQKVQSFMHTTTATKDSDSTESSEKDQIPVQFDEDGELDLATMQRMLDILYKQPSDPEGYESLETNDKNEYRFRKDSASGDHQLL